MKTPKVDGGVKGVTSKNNARLHFFSIAPMLAKIANDARNLNE